MRGLAFLLLFLPLAAQAAQLSRDDALRIGRSGDLAGLRALVAERNRDLLFQAVNAWPRAGMRQLPAPLEALIVEHYADPVAQRPLLAFIARDLERFERLPKYRSRALFERLYADLKSGKDSLYYGIYIIATDLPVEAELAALLPQLDAEGANELVMFLGARKYAPAAPALKALQARIPRERNVNGVRERIDWALLQINTPESVQAVLARLRSLREDKDPRATHEIWAILLHAKDLPPESGPDYAELRAALPPSLSHDSWQALVELIARRKEKRGTPELVRAIGESPNPAAAAEALLALGEPADLRAGRAALEQARGLPAQSASFLKQKFDQAIADPAYLAAQREQKQKDAAEQSAARAMAAERSRIAAFRQSDPARYGAEMRALLDREAPRLRADEAGREYVALGSFLRFRAGKPDDALAAFEAARRFRRPGEVDFAVLAIADLQRFDKRAPARAIDAYRAGLRSVESVDATGQNAQLVLPLKQWLGHEIAYLQGGRRFTGAIGRNDMAAAQLWLMFGSMHESLQQPLDDRALAGLAPSQYQIARSVPSLFELPPAQMLAFFAKHDPAGYLTAGILGAASYGGNGSPFVKAAAQAFFRERGIRDPSSARADPRYADPEKTWGAFLAAGKAGNAAGMLDCLTPEMQRRFQPLFAKMSRDELRAMAASFVGFALQESYGELREAMVVRRQDERRMAGTVTFVNEGGAWKIAEM